jgi:hypothetical protein
MPARPRVVSWWLVCQVLADIRTAKVIRKWTHDE